MQKILITGANGFVGSHIAERLVSKNYSVRCLVRKTSDLKWVKNLPLEFCYGDITEPEALEQAVKDIDIIFHSAGVVRVSKTENYYKVNHIGTKNLIEAVYKFNPDIKRFVYISTQSVMGPSQADMCKGLNESCIPVSHYGKSKLLGEAEVLKYRDKLPVTVLRPAAVYGPRDKDLFPFFKVAAQGFFTIMSGDRNCKIQLLFIKDLAEICCLIAEAKETGNDIYFLAENRIYTWEEIGRILGCVSGRNVKIITFPLYLVNIFAVISEFFASFKNMPAKLNRDKVKEFCQKYWTADTSVFEKDFELKFTQLEIGAKITYNWYKENHWL